MNRVNYPCYLYQHENGEIIAKNPVVCEYGTTPWEYFDSPFVKRWAKVEDEIEADMFVQACKHA